MKKVIKQKKTRLQHLWSLELMARELDVEMDGVKCPASAASILNTMRNIIREIDIIDEEEGN